MEIRKPISQQPSSIIRKKPVSKIAQKRVKRNKKRGVAAVVVAIFFIVVLVLLSRLEKLFIKNIYVSGVRPEYKITIEEQIRIQLKGSSFFVFPKKNIFLFPEDKLTEVLLKNNSYLESISLSRKGLDSLYIQAKERAPYFSVQGTENSSLFIDTFGVVYTDPNTEISTSTIILRETAEHYSASTTGGLPVDLQNQKGKALSELYFKNLKKVMELFKAKNFTIYSVTLRPYGDADLQIAEQGGVIRINLYDDIDKTVATFSAARKIETLRSKLSAQRETLQYIDLRFGNKVFYMFSPGNAVTQ